MMEHHNITKATFEFINRDGVPTALVLTPPTGDPSSVEVEVSTDGLSIAVNYFSTFENDVPANWRYDNLEDREGVPAPQQDGQGVAKTPELGKVGQVILTAVALAIVVPFIGILWAWSAGVVRGMGGLW